MQDPIKSLHFSSNPPVCHAFDPEAKDSHDLLIGLASGDGKNLFCSKNGLPTNYIHLWTNYYFMCLQFIWCLCGSNCKRLERSLLEHSIITKMVLLTARKPLTLCPHPKIITALHIRVWTCFLFLHYIAPINDFHFQMLAFEFKNSYCQ